MIRPSVAALVCGALIGAAALTGCASDNNPPAGVPDLSQTLATADAKLDVSAARAMISGYRVNNGLGPVTIDPELMKLASQQAHAMAAHNELEHDVLAPFAQRIQNSSFDASVAVENIAAGYQTLGQVFAGWRHSPEHRANMLNKYVTRMGIAEVYAPQTRYKVFWSLILAKRDRQPSPQSYTSSNMLFP